MKNYVSYKAMSTDDILIGLLSAFPFESFEENDDHIIGYISEDALTDEIQNGIHDVLKKHDVTFLADIIAPQNWNKKWESNFKPVVVDDFCSIRADFHPPNTDVEYDIVINPKMAFGTGHHETTYMMLSEMRSIDIGQKQLLDYGCGTGILAIQASLLGAKKIDAVDIEQESYENTIENSKINNVANVSAFQGDLNVLESNNQTYDIILANINRNVLIGNSDKLYGLLEKDGVILLSGILEEDQDKVRSKYEASGFKHVTTNQKGNWLCLKLEK